LFYGEYLHTLDLKNRVSVPSRFRQGLGDKFILTKGFDDCLFAYSLGEWENLEKKVKSLPLSDTNARAFVRFFFAGASECEIDKQGRTLIPKNLCDYAGLKKDLYINGVSDRVEIWSREKWEEHSGEYSRNADKIAEKIALLGI
jgi:MraZ protein